MLIIIVLALPMSAAAQSLEEEVGGRIKERIASLALQGFEREIYVSKMLQDFYAKRIYTPAWIDNIGVRELADDLLYAISEAYAEGLRPEFYGLEDMKSALIKTRLRISAGRFLDPAMMADLDIRLTKGFLSYGLDLLTGRVNPALIEGEWADVQWESNLPELLEDALIYQGIEEYLAMLVPPYKGYARLREALARYDDISLAGGWPQVPEGRVLRKGMREKRVALLKDRLRISGDLGDGNGGKLFDDSLKEAVRRFQARHGLAADGAAGPLTIAALNVPVDRRISQIEMNMERLRWLPRDLGERYILVNIANFELSVIDSDQTVLEMRIIAGRPMWDTPSFSASMKYIVLNPSWYVPRTIAVEEMLPMLKRDASYLDRNGIRMYEHNGGTAVRKKSVDIDWRRVGEEDFGFGLMQPPGPDNPLGRIKFMMPNRFGVYLHDTPARELFSSNVRTFSHGCIRMERPLALVNYLLSEDPFWKYADIEEEIQRGSEQEIYLSRQVPVHILYWTTWVDEKGIVNFRDDIYDRDDALAALLFD